MHKHHAVQSGQVKFLSFTLDWCWGGVVGDGGFCDSFWRSCKLKYQFCAGFGCLLVSGLNRLTMLHARRHELLFLGCQKQLPYCSGRHMLVEWSQMKHQLAAFVSVFAWSQAVCHTHFFLFIFSFFFPQNHTFFMHKHSKLISLLHTKPFISFN